MKLVALDLSIRSCGWAMWSHGQDRPACGTWELAPHIDYAARAFVRLHKNLLDLHRLETIDAVVFEECIPAHKLHTGSSAETIFAVAGLAAHAMSFAEAIGAQWRSVSMAAWRRHFIGKMPRGTKTPDLKAMAMKRCRELGFEAIKHDAAEACGLLDYELSVRGITAPWRMENALQEQLVP